MMFTTVYMETGTSTTQILSPHTTDSMMSTTLTLSLHTTVFTETGTSTTLTQ